MYLEQPGEYRLSLHFVALYNFIQVREGILSNEFSRDFQRIIKIGCCFSAFTYVRLRFSTSAQFKIGIF